MSRPELEDDIRRALRRRAEQAPSGVPSPVASRRSDRRPLFAVAGVGVVVAALVALALVGSRSEPSHVAAGDPTPTTVRPATTWLAFDDPSYHYLRTDEGSCRGPSPVTTVRLQSFGTSYYASPILFVQTIPDYGPQSSFGLLDGDRGDPVTVRGVAGFASRDRSADRAWFVSAVLPDGDAIFAVALGLDTSATLDLLDSLAPRADGGWSLPTPPPGWSELPPSTPTAGCGYSAGGNGFEVNLYVDAFDSRLQDRVGSTVGRVDQIDLAGLPAAIGDYRDDDHWVMAEPGPGLTLEIRASGMTRAQTIELVRHARFVDEATWQAMAPEPGSSGPTGTSPAVSTTTPGS